MADRMMCHHSMALCRCDVPEAEGVQSGIRVDAHLRILSEEEDIEVVSLTVDECDTDYSDGSSSSYTSETSKPESATTLPRRCLGYEEEDGVDFSGDGDEGDPKPKDKAVCEKISSLPPSSHAHRLAPKICHKPDGQNKRGKSDAYKQKTTEDPKEKEEALKQNAIFEPQTSVEPQAAVVEMPPAVKCSVCPRDIQPTTEVYYQWTCMDQCAFYLHKACLHDQMAHQGYKKKREYKDAVCATEGCSAQISAIFEYNMMNVESLYIKSEHEKLEKVESKKFDKLKATLAKDQKKAKKEVNTKKQKAERDHVTPDNAPDSSPSSVRQGTPEDPIEDAIMADPVIILPSEKPSVVEEPVKHNPLEVEIDQVAVPLQKKKDELESKYTVTQQKTTFKVKAKKKKEVLDVFSQPIRQPYGHGRFDEPQPPSASFNSNQVPDRWDDERSNAGTIASSQGSQGSFVRIHDPQEFPNVAFPLPGSESGEVFMDQILDTIAPRFDDIAINSPQHREGANLSICQLQDAVLLTAGDLLEDAQVDFIKKLFDGYDDTALRMFIQGLKYFTVAKSGDGYTYCKNSKGRDVQERYQVLAKEAQQKLSMAQKMILEQKLLQKPPQEQKLPGAPRNFSTLIKHDHGEFLGQEGHQPTWHGDFNQYDNEGYNEEEKQAKDQEFYDAPEEHEYYANPQEEQFVAEHFVPQNPRTERTMTFSSRDSPLLDQGLSAAERERLEMKKNEDIDKKIALKISKLDIRAQMKKEEQGKRVNEEEDLSRRDFGYNHEEAHWGSGANSVIPPSLHLKAPSAVAEWYGICEKENEPVSSIPPGFQRKPELSQRSQQVFKAEPVPYLKVRNVSEEAEQGKRSAENSNQKLREMQRLLEESYRQQEEIEQRMKAAELERQNMVAAGNERSVEVESLHVRLQEQMRKKEAIEAELRQTRLQNLRAEATTQLKATLSCIHHHGIIISKLLECRVPEFAETVEELVEHQRCWLTHEQFARERLKLIESGHDQVPELPDPPILSKKLMAFFQKAEDTGKYTYHPMMEKYFEQVKAALLSFSQIANQEMCSSTDVKIMLIRELHNQPENSFDVNLAIRRMASERGYCHFSEPSTSRQSSMAPSSAQSSVSHLTAKFSAAGSSAASSRAASSSPANVPPSVGRKKKKASPKNVKVIKYNTDPKCGGKNPWGPSTSATDRDVNYTEASCEICLETMHLSETLHSCVECKEPFHRKCVLEWLDKEATCPHCRANMPHPGHFPALR